MSASEISDLQLKLFDEWKRTHAKKDPDAVVKLMHKDFRKATYPRSLGRPEETREEWLANMKKIMSLWTESPEPTVHSIIANIPGKMVIHLTTRAKTSVGVDVERESIVTVHIVTDEDGSLKYKRLEEFTDSQAHVEYFKALTEAMSRQQGA